MSNGVIFPQGHETVGLSRGRSERNGRVYDKLVEAGVKMTMSNLDRDGFDKLVDILKGCDLAVCALSGTCAVIPQEELIFEAVEQAGVRRFIPDEFGVHTQSMPQGVGKLFDLKKGFVDNRLRSSSVKWTIIYPGGIQDWFIPNVREYPELTTFGDLDIPIVTHDLSNIAELTIRAGFDPRAIDKCVHVKQNRTTQRTMLELIQQTYPNAKLPTLHVTTDEIERVANDPSQGLEMERMQINRACYVQGYILMDSQREDTLDGGSLFPDIKWKSVEECINDPVFMGVEK